MTRAQRQQLKEIDGNILRTALVLQNLIRDRAALDRDSTLALIDEITKTLRTCAGSTWNETPPLDLKFRRS